MLSKILCSGNGLRIFQSDVLLPLALNNDDWRVPYLIRATQLIENYPIEDISEYPKFLAIGNEACFELLENIVKEDYETLSQDSTLKVLTKLSQKCSDNGEFFSIANKMKALVAFPSNEWQSIIKPFQDDLRNRIYKNENAISNVSSKEMLLKLDIQEWLQESNVIGKLFRQKEIQKLYGLSRQDFLDLAYSLDSSNSKPKPTRFNSNEFFEITGDGNQWLITGLIPNQGVTIIGALAGCGKTTLAYDLAGSVIYGDEFLGELPLKTGNVLIVASDELPVFSQDKLLNRGITEGFDYVQNWDASDFPFLDKTIEECLPKLIIVDSFSSIHSHDPNFSENSPMAANTVKQLEALSCKYSVPVVLIHHLAKSKDNSGVNRLRGSSAIAAACSNILILDGEGSVKKLKQVKVRGSEPLELEIKMVADEGTFKVISGNQDSQDTKSLAKRLQSFFEANQGNFYGKNELLEAFPSDNYENLQKSLTRLVKQGILTRKPCPNHKSYRVWGKV